MGVRSKLQDSNQESLLSEMVDSLNRLNETLDTLVKFDAKLLKVNEEILEKISGGAGPSRELALAPDTLSILSLPMALRKTVMVLYKLEQATADDLARETKRLRAVESAAANELVRMGYVKKKREGRDVYFYIDTPEETKT